MTGFIRGSLIYVDGTFLPIERLNIGQDVRVYEDEDPLKVLDIRFFIANYIYTLTLDTGAILRLTNNQLVYTEEGVYQASQLREQDKVERLNGTASIVSLRKDYFTSPMYQLVFNKEFGLYCVDDVIVANVKDVR